jgi:hypothetical protein
MSRIEVLEATHRPVAPLYPSVILFDHVVFILTGAVINVGAEFVGNGLGIAGMVPSALAPAHQIWWLLPIHEAPIFVVLTHSGARPDGTWFAAWRVARIHKIVTEEIQP